MFARLLRTKKIAHALESRWPDAIATIKGSPDYRELRGEVQFYGMDDGVLVAAEVYGLPHDYSDCGINVFGFHIHSGKVCDGTTANPFADADGHYNPGMCPHPAHAGDLPPLFGCHGQAFCAVFTDRFHISEVIGRAVIIHANPDDFTTQPSGNAGPMIGCGTIHAIGGSV